MRVRDASSPSTPAARTPRRTCSSRPSAPTPSCALRRRRPSRPPYAWAWSAVEDAADAMGLDPPRRRQPGTRRAGRAAGRGRGRPRGRRARPQAARVALAAPPARGRRDDLRHRPAGDGPGAQRVRPGPARRRPHRARRQHRRHARATFGARGARRASTSSSRCSATTSTSAGAPPRQGTRRSWCPPRWSSTPRPPTVVCGVRRSPAATRTTRSDVRRCTHCWPTPEAVRCRGRSCASGSGRCCGWSGSCWSARSVRPSTSSPPWSRSTAAPARCSPPGASGSSGGKGLHKLDRRGPMSAGCWRRGGCPTVTASTRSATSSRP